MSESEPILRVGTTASSVSVQSTLSMASRYYLAAEHLWQALHCARSAADIEEAYQGSGADFNVRHRAYVVSAIFAAVSFLEASVNELFEDAFDVVYEGRAKVRLSPLEDKCIALMAEAWSSLSRHADAVTKYQLALLFADKPRFEMGRAPMQDVPLVVELRNSLIHFKPRWHEHAGVDKWENKLRGKFAASPLLASTTNPWFPGKCLSAGCAEWASNVCRDLVDAWSERLGLSITSADALAGWETP